jgi:hypothetical protein
MFPRVFAGILILVLCGCSDNMGSLDLGTPEPAVDLKIPSSKSRGIYRTTGIDDQMIRQTTTCPTNQMATETRLHSGQEFTLERAWSKIGGGFEGEDPYQIVIETVDPDHASLIEREGIGSTWIRLSCTLTGSAARQVNNCAIADKSDDVSVGKNPDHVLHCTIKDNSSTQFKSHSDSGTYTFSTGLKVNAVRTVTHNAGLVECNDASDDAKTPVGPGTVEQTTIQSIEVPEPEGYGCGPGTTLFQYEVAKDKRGTVLSVSKREIQAAKL